MSVLGIEIINQIKEISMPRIHLVERLENTQRVDKDRNEWESGYWAVSEETAHGLIGGQIYLHRGQLEPSHFGGDILSFRMQPDGDFAGRLIFRFRTGVEFKGIKTAREGWGNEKKIIW